MDERAIIKELQAALKLAEWGGDEGWCDCCKRLQHEGHDLGCEIKNALERAAVYLETQRHSGEE